RNRHRDVSTVATPPTDKTRRRCLRPPAGPSTRREVVLSKLVNRLSVAEQVSEPPDHGAPERMHVVDLGIDSAERALLEGGVEVFATQAPVVVEGELDAAAAGEAEQRLAAAAHVGIGDGKTAGAVDQDAVEGPADAATNIAQRLEIEIGIADADAAEFQIAIDLAERDITLDAEHEVAGLEVAAAQRTAMEPLTIVDREPAAGTGAEPAATTVAADVAARPGEGGRRRCFDGGRRRR